jgi:hypothetical protein
VRSLYIFSAIGLLSCKAQRQSDFNASEKIHLLNAGISETFSVTDASLKRCKQLSYHWYSGKALFISIGGYSGKLLSGDYVSYYENGALYKKGSFRNGLKNGLWVTWSVDGKMVERASWYNGVIHGERELFDPQGSLMATLRYRNGRLDGRCIWFSETRTDTCFYSGGFEVSKKVKRDLWHF